MKYKKALKRLVVSAVIVIFLLSVFGGFLYFVNEMDMEYTSKVAALQSETDAIVRDRNILKDQYSKVDENAAIYREISQKTEKNALTINKNFLRDVVADMRKKYYFSDIKVNLIAGKPLEDPKYKRSVAVIDATDVNIDLQTVSDENIYWMIRDFQEAFSGVKVTHVAFSLLHSLDAQALQSISQQGGAPLVKGDIKFTWFGLAPVVVDDMADALSATSAAKSHPPHKKP